jgi:succinate dehydrogenase/fumarate reductase flavoprotein subunit
MSEVGSYRRTIHADTIPDLRSRFDRLCTSYNAFLDRSGIRHAVTGASKVDAAAIRKEAAQYMPPKPATKTTLDAANMNVQRLTILRKELTGWFNCQQVADVLGVSKYAAYGFLQRNYTNGMLQRSRRTTKKTYKWRVL